MIDDSELRDLDPFALFDGEARRLDGFLARLRGDDWLEATRCAGWRRREVLAHLAATEDYNHATLDGTVPQLIERARREGAEQSIDGFNAWGVRLRDERTVEELLDEWRDKNSTTRRGVRERGWDGMLATFVGPYPAGLQALHLAMELTVHTDDMGMPVDGAERALRGTWQARFARFSVREYGRAVSIEPDDGGNRVSAGGEECVVDDEALVHASTARLPAGHPMPQALRDLLRILA